MLRGLGSLYVSQMITLLPSYVAWKRRRGDVSHKAVGTVKKAEEMEFPVKLNEIVRVLVKRPAINRTKKDKEKANEILLVSNIELDGEKYVKFDVFVNDKDKVPTATPADSEFAGSFAQIPHGRTDKRMMMTSGVRFGLNELLEDIKAEDDEYILVTLVPRSGCDDVTVSEIKIGLVPIV
ncbi:polyphenol oxidase I, chloroplastic-like protein [Tanacetum coccineum]